MDRLQTDLWSEAAKYMNSSFTIVGDLGEAKVATFRIDLCVLMGDWIRRDDNPLADDVEGGGGVEDIEFNFMAASENDPAAGDGDADVPCLGGSGGQWKMAVG